MKDSNKAPERLSDPNVDASSTGKSAAKKKDKKPSFFVRAPKALARWFREMRSELKKVVWPTPKQTLNNVVIALVVMACSGVMIWAFDQVASLAIKALVIFAA